ncbi:hypothetical protein ATN79_20215 [Paraburkholderia caribensis]|nr:hypothetical protein ATN79_20215 [Paraburkholderia caribensis]
MATRARWRSITLCHYPSRRRCSATLFRTVVDDGARGWFIIRRSQRLALVRFNEEISSVID